MTIREMTPPDSIAETTDMLLRLAVGGMVSSYETRRITKDGRILDIWLTATSLFDASGKIVEAFATTERDITDRKKAEVVQGRLAAIVENAEDAIIGTDMDAIIKTWNAGAENIFGYKAAEVIGRHLSLLLPPGHTDDTPIILARIKQGEHIEDFETVRMRKDETIISASVKYSAIKDASGRIVGASKIVHDITKRKQTENALRLAHAELEHRALELDAVNRELDAFAQTVSNDLKAPLRIIEGFARAIAEDYDDKLDETGKNYVRRVTAACQRMIQLTDAMLSMARLTSGELYEQNVDLSVLATGIAYDLQQKEPQRHVEFAISPHVRTKGDATMLEIVLRNLLDNAWKFTSKHPAAKIEFGVTDMEGNIVFFVRDDGAGFDVQYADKLFQPFKRMHTDAEYPGLGIGLAIAHRIIMRHGGRMWAEGKVEKGSTFYFTLK